MAQDQPIMEAFAVHDKEKDLVRVIFDFLNISERSSYYLLMVVVLLMLIVLIILVFVYYDKSAEGEANLTTTINAIVATVFVGLVGVWMKSYSKKMLA